MCTTRSILCIITLLCIGLTTDCQEGVREEEKRAFNFFCGACIGLTSFALPQEYAAPVLVSSMLIKLGIASHFTTKQTSTLTQNRYFRSGDFIEGVLRGSMIGSGALFMAKHTQSKQPTTYECEVSLS